MWGLVAGKKMTVVAAAKQSWRCQVVPVGLRRAIKQFLREEEVGHMKKKVVRLRESFTQMKDLNRLLPLSVSKDLIDHPLHLPPSSSSSSSSSPLFYRHDHAAAYVASRMPSVFAACFRVLREIRRRLPHFSPSRVLDFGSGTGSAFWALREVWPHSLHHLNLIEPSQSMQRAAVTLSRDLKNMPQIHSYNSILSLTKDINNSERQHDLVIASYVLGEIPSVKDRIATLRKLWGLTRDILVLIEPGTPEGSHIISQMRSHILWMEKRKTSKRKDPSDEVTKDPKRDGAFIIAPCPHDGPCPLVSTGKFCHFVQRVQRTESQRAYKKSNGSPMRGFEDEKFSYVVFQRGKRPQEPWPLDDIKFETLKEMQANRKLEDLEVDYEDQFESDTDEIVPFQIPRSYDSSATETEADVDTVAECEDEEAEDDTGRADLGTGWGRIIFMPQRRGRRVEMDVCRATKRDGSEGSFEHLVITRGQNPTLHRQARKSLWGDLWPF
ncbi:hypothetical protein vseg_016902 [Gypsophila vaccaria]